MRTVIVLLLLLVAGIAGGAAYFQIEHRRAVEREAAALTGGDADQGRDAIKRYGCVACHEIPGFAGTTAYVGPPLTRFGLRMYVAGAIENKPENLMAFLRDPRAHVPHGAMPNLHVTDNDARDLAAFLYTLQ